MERGVTTLNNHDLKDMLKAHIAPDAQHLFLRVCRRLGAFFGDPRREVDVLSLHVFGYGGTTLDAP